MNNVQYMLSLILVAMLTYVVCLSEHRRIVRRMKRDQELTIPRAKIQGMLELIEDPKMLRETLCVAQTAIGASGLDPYKTDRHFWRLQRIIDSIDVFRPLGPDGRHGDQHTEWCGCEDK